VIKIRTQRSPAETEQIRQLLMTDNTFKNVFAKNWTDNVMNDLRKRLFGRIPRNFVVNISGLIGTPTGIFKSSMGLQIALALDPTFNIKHRVAFSVNELLDKIRYYSEYKLCNRCFLKFINSYYGTYETYDFRKDEKCDNCDNIANKQLLLTKLIFFLDEQTKTLKTGGLIRLMNIVDTARQRQLCFITCGVEGYDLSFTTYNLKRIQESNDDYLPKKIVRYSVRDEARRMFYGFFRWNITPLTDPFWKRIWNEYSVVKTDFQRIAMAQQTTQMNLEDYAQEIIDSDDFLKCFKTLRDNRKVFQPSLARNLIYQRYADFTREEKDMILSQIKMNLYDDEENGEE